MFQHNRKNYTAICDQVLTYIFMKEMKSTETSHILDLLEELQKEFWKTSKIVSDNGSNLVSQEMQAYCMRRNMKHETSSPYSSSSNSHSEIGVEKDTYALRMASITS